MKIVVIVLSVAFIAATYVYAQSPDSFPKNEMPMPADMCYKPDGTPFVISSVIDEGNRFSFSYMNTDGNIITTRYGTRVFSSNWDKEVRIVITGGTCPS